MTVGEALASVSARLAAAGVESPRVDAELLVAHVLGVRRSELPLERDRVLVEEEASSLERLVARRVRREPLAYVLGEWGFRRLTLLSIRACSSPGPRPRWSSSAASRASRGSPSHACSTSARAAARLRSRSPTSIPAPASPGSTPPRVRSRSPAPTRSGRGFRSSSSSTTSGRAFPTGPGISSSRTRPTSARRRSRRSSPRCASGSRATRSSASARPRPWYTAHWPVLAAGGALVLEIADRTADEVARLLERSGYADVRATLDLAGRERVVEGTRG